MANYRMYKGSEIFTLSEEKQEALVEGLLYENDVLLLVAPPKMSKTVFAVQLACNLSNGTPFLDVLAVPKALRVLYIATEMKDEELKDRFIRTSAFVPANPDNLTLVCTKGTPYKLNSQMGTAMTNMLIAQVKASPPKVIFIDSVYKAFHGSLKDDDPVNQFLTEVDRIATELDAAVVLVHHLKKAAKDAFNNDYKSSDADTFGSQFILGAVDHVIRLEKVYKEHAPLDRYIKCDSQRTGNIITDMRIRLHEPNPLYFHIVDNYAAEKHDLLKIMGSYSTPMNIAELMKHSGFNRAKIYQILKELLKEDKIVKGGSKIKTYGVKKGE